MLTSSDHLSIGLLIRRFTGRIAITWGLVFLETAMFALLPLLIGWSIDGLLNGDFQIFHQLIWVLAALLVVSIGRRVYDTRAYGTIRAQMGEAQFVKGGDTPISRGNARVLMGRELVDFLEDEAPETLTALVQVIAAIVILSTFSITLGLSAGCAAIIMLLIFSLSARRFFHLNGHLNEQSEAQINALESRDLKKVSAHFLNLRRHEVRLSDWESLIYGLIFAVLLSMLLFNLYYSATTLGASAGAIFSIVTYSFEFVESAVALPITLQSLTRLKEITQRINQTEEQD